MFWDDMKQCSAQSWVGSREGRQYSNLRPGCTSSSPIWYLMPLPEDSKGAGQAGARCHCSHAAFRLGSPIVVVLKASGTGVSVWTKS